MIEKVCFENGIIVDFISGEITENSERLDNLDGRQLLILRGLVESAPKVFYFKDINEIVYEDYGKWDESRQNDLGKNLSLIKGKCKFPKGWVKKCADYGYQLIIKFDAAKDIAINAELPFLMERDTLGKREKEMGEIDEAFERNNIFALTGIGGIGKSTLAIMYGYHYRQNGKEVLFVRFYKTFFDTVIHLPIRGYEVLDVNGEEKELQTIFNEKIELVSKLCTEDTLLILDDVYDSNKSFEELVSGDDNGLSYMRFLKLPVKKLLTTRYEVLDLPSGLVEVLSEEELLRIMDTFYPYETEQTKEVRKELIDEVCGHTLAVELIARTLNSLRGMKTPQQLLGILKQNRLSNTALPKVYTDANKRKDTIFNHLCTLFDSSNLLDGEKDILSFMVVVPVWGIKCDIFLKCCDDMKDTIDAVNQLIEKGWLRCDTVKNILSMHPLIKAVVDDDWTLEDYIKQMEFQSKVEILDPWWQTPNGWVFEELDIIMNEIIDISIGNLSGACAKMMIEDETIWVIDELLEKKSLRVIDELSRNNIVKDIDEIKNYYKTEIYVKIMEILLGIAYDAEEFGLECVKLVKSHFEETGEVDGNMIYEFAKKGEKNSIVPAIRLLSICYKYGWGVKENEEEAKKYYELWKNGSFIGRS